MITANRMKKLIFGRSMKFFLILSDLLIIVHLRHLQKPLIFFGKQTLKGFMKSSKADFKS